MSNYKSDIPEIANRIKYCMTPETVIEFFKAELQNAYDNGFQMGFVEYRIRFKRS